MTSATTKKIFQIAGTFLIFFVCSYLMNYFLQGTTSVLQSAIFAIVTTTVLAIANGTFRKSN